MYAERLVAAGEIDKAKGFLAKHNLSWPPFPARSVVAANAAADLASEENAAREKELEALRAKLGADEPISTEAAASTVAPPVVEVLQVTGAAPKGNSGDVVSVETLVNATGLDPRRERPAVVTHFCPNPRLVGIKFLDGKQERASMWLGWRNVRINDKVTVHLERGLEDVNGIYEEVGVRV